MTLISLVYARRERHFMPRRYQQQFHLAQELAYKVGRREPDHLPGVCHVQVKTIKIQSKKVFLALFNIIYSLKFFGAEFILMFYKITRL